MKSLLRFWVFVVTIIILSLFIVSPSFASDIKKKKLYFLIQMATPLILLLLTKVQ